MRAALRDPALVRYARRFVWLTLDYENPKNQAFLAQHISGFPSSYVLEPGRGNVVATLLGSASVEEVEKFLDEASRTPVAAADDALRRGDALLGQHDAASSVPQYRQALKLGGKAWPNRAHALEQLMAALQFTDAAKCAATAEEEAPSMSHSRSYVGVVLTGLVCASSSTSTDVSTARHLEALANEAVALPSAAEDDRYQLYDALIAARTQAKDDAGTQRIAERYLADVDRAPAPNNADERSARDLARLRAALALGTVERIIPVLEASERAMPDNYTASARLAKAYAAAHRLDDAIAACTRGLARGPGPIGSTRLLTARAQAQKARKSFASARADLTAALETAKKIPVPTDREQVEKSLRAMLQELEG